MHDTTLFIHLSTTFHRSVKYHKFQYTIEKKLYLALHFTIHSTEIKENENTVRDKLEGKSVFHRITFV